MINTGGPRAGDETVASRGRMGASGNLGLPAANAGESPSRQGSAQRRGSGKQNRRATEKTRKSEARPTDANARRPSVEEVLNQFR